MPLSEPDRLKLLAYQREGESWAAFAGRAQVSEKTIKEWCLGTSQRTPSPKKLSFAFNNLKKSAAGVVADTKSPGGHLRPLEQIGKTLPIVPKEGAGMVDDYGELARKMVEGYPIKRRAEALDALASWARDHIRYASGGAPQPAARRAEKRGRK